ncbi:hypothetical protein, partial [Pseudomonas sp. MPR-AND1A]|uniref:hypothetical protein n=1 Tax=Pseudomonas sp. MPR-AND1A TaxID=2070600 RepID=UPI000CBE9416
ARHSFLLLDDSGQLFGTRNLKEDEKILLIFIPDYLQEHVYQELRQFSAFLPTLKAKKIEVALVSRGTVDGGTSLKQASQY